MRTLRFTQITDSRFDNDIQNLLADRVKLIKEKLSALEGVRVKAGASTHYEFPGDEPNEQYRSEFYVVKEGRKTTWDDVYRAVNSVKAVPYRFEDVNFDEIVELPEAAPTMPQELSLIKDYMVEKHLESVISNYKENGDMAYVTLDTNSSFGHSSAEIEFKKGDIISFLEGFYDVADGYNYVEEPYAGELEEGERILDNFNSVRDYVIKEPAFNLEVKILKALESRDVQEATLIKMGIPQELVPTPKAEELEPPEVKAPEESEYTPLDVLIAEAEQELASSAQGKEKEKETPDR